MTTSATTTVVTPSQHRRMAEIRSRRIGVELETVGSTREHIAKKIAEAIQGSTVRQGGDAHQSLYIVQPDGREWRVMSDGAITGDHGCNTIVSPVMSWSDVSTLQAVVRAARKARARVDTSCNMRVHVDAREVRSDVIGRLVTLVSNYDAMLDSMLAISPARRRQWCQPLPADKLQALRAAAASAPGDVAARQDAALRAAWTAGEVPGRKHGLGLQHLFTRGTVEFCHFSGTLHGGEVRAFVALALAFVARAIHTTSVEPGAGWGRVGATRPRTALHNFYHDVGFRADDAEFANVRAHLGRWLNPMTPTAEDMDAAEVAAQTPARPRRAARPSAATV